MTAPGAIFARGDAPGVWTPSALAGGPFSGLQGGAIASLLTAEAEAFATARKWGTAISVTVSFLKPTPMSALRTQIMPLREGGRVNVIDNTLYADVHSDPCATARIAFINDRSIETPDIPQPPPLNIDPSKYPQRVIKSFHGRPWMMDAMEARAGDGVFWFRQTVPTIEGASPENLSAVLGPADWTHGLARPLHNVVADPNPNLTVHLLKAPRGGWIGIRALCSWDTARGVGVGDGTIMDVHGEIGNVSMAVALTPFPKSA
ncbi:MAG: thioesterase family protein [Afipia sp.]|nr:thioesterase family protein [Afipia sp.]